MGVTSWFHESWVLRRVLRKVCYSYVSAGALFNMQVIVFIGRARGRCLAGSSLVGAMVGARTGGCADCG